MSKDKEKIEFFFSYLVQCENLGFVLFGDTKTAAFYSIPIVCKYSVVPVSFRGNPGSSEVKSLIDTYTKEILEIENIFKSDSFLTTTLERFCSP